MDYILKKSILIDRPLVFLCGPYFINEPYDRRKILIDFFDNDKYKKIIPLVIDKFLAQKYIDDKSINVQLMEEIIACVSSKTYIFLDTMSAASELGLFTTNAFGHNVHVFLPKDIDIIDKKNVGYFVKDIMLEHDKGRIDVEYYNPKIIRFPIATNLVKEHYGFMGNKIPKKIKNIIENERLFEKKPEEELEYFEGAPTSDRDSDIYYQLNEGRDKLIIHLSFKLLFYITVSCAYKKYKNSEIENNSIVSNEILNQIENCLKNTLALKNGISLDKKSVEIKSGFSRTSLDLVRHILTFMKCYHNPKSSYRGRKLILSENYIIEKYSEDSYKRVEEIFGIKITDWMLIRDINSNPDNYFETLQLKTGKKKREVVIYKDSENGSRAKQIHNRIKSNIEKKYQFSDTSYAYKKNKNIRKCAEKHIDSSEFLKLDIKNFFNSINKNKLIEKIIQIFNFDKLDKGLVGEIILSCSYNGKIPIGLVVSPLLSDIYLNSFDYELEAKLNKDYLGFRYTRYADDILISSKDTFDYNNIKDSIISLLKHEMLKINEKKVFSKKLKKEGDHIKYVGLSIVKGQKKRII